MAAPDPEAAAVAGSVAKSVRAALEDLPAAQRDPGLVPHRVEGDPDLAATLLHAATTLGCD